MATPPHNVDAEEALLASLLIDAEYTMSICLSEGITHDSFYRPDNGLVYWAISQMLQEGQPVDLITFNEWAKRADVSIAPGKGNAKAGGSVLDAIGGPTRAATLTARIESTLNAQHWASIVVEAWRGRTIAHAASAALSSIGRGATASDTAGALVTEVTKVYGGATRRTLCKMGEIAPRAYQVMEEARQGINKPGIPTGLKALDDSTGGIKPGELIVIAARPGMGKSSLLSTIADYISVRKNGAGLIFSLEMGADSIATRMMCAGAGVNMRRYTDGVVGASEQISLERYSKRISAAPLYIEDRSIISASEISLTARMLAGRLSREGAPLKYIGVDYLQLIAVDKEDKGRVPREQVIAGATRMLKCLAKDLNVPILLLSQLNRESEKEKRAPRLDDLRESGAIEQDADVVMFLHANAVDPSTLMSDFSCDLIIAKQRNGSLGVRRVVFERPFTRFSDFKNTAQN